MKLICLLILLLVGCSSQAVSSAGCDTPEALLRAYVDALPRPDLIKGLCYRPGTVETFGQDWDEFVFNTSNSHLTVRDALLVELDDSEQRESGMVHNGVVAVAMPKPLGWLRVNFDDAEGVSERFVRVLYGEVDGKYFIATWQRPSIVE